MEALLISMSGLEKLFLACALFGGILFVIRMVLLFIGGSADIDTDVDIGGDVDFGGDVDIDMEVDVDVDADVGVEADVGDGEVALQDSTASFRLLTFQGLTGFFMMFGLVGLALTRQTKVSEPWAIVGAFIWGLLTLWVIAKMFQFMKSLQSSGTIDMRNAVGQEGTVYLTIPAGGTGKAQVAIQDRLRVLDAVTQDGEKLKTGEPIRVVRVKGDNVLIVERAEP
jgi:membrane protein implicated in regulation of membrane protease activity